MGSYVGVGEDVVRDGGGMVELVKNMGVNLGLEGEVKVVGLEGKWNV